MSKYKGAGLIKPGIELIMDADLHVNSPYRGVQALILLDYSSGTPVTAKMLREYIEMGLVEAESVVCVSLTDTGRIRLAESKADET